MNISFEKVYKLLSSSRINSDNTKVSTNNHTTKHLESLSSPTATHFTSSTHATSTASDGISHHLTCSIGDNTNKQISSTLVTNNAIDRFGCDVNNSYTSRECNINTKEHSSNNIKINITNNDNNKNNEFNDKSSNNVNNKKNISKTSMEEETGSVVAMMKENILDVIEVRRENSIESETDVDCNNAEVDAILADLHNYGDNIEEEYLDATDPCCDPSKPQKVTFQEISSAAFMVKGSIERTPCDKSRMSGYLGMNIFFKKDFRQYTGSFKERGACYTLMSLTSKQKQRGVIAASAGNHALGLAYHGQRLKVPIIVVMPTNSPLMKQELCKQFGAHVVLHGSDFGSAKQFALAMSKKHDILYINGYDHPMILAGQGTMGIEIVEQVPEVDAVVIPVGGGGLAAGVALSVKTLKPKVKIYGVESEKVTSFSSALRAGHPVLVNTLPTLADGLAVPCVGENAFATLKPLLDKMIIVHEEFIALAILRLVEMEKCVVEGAGATGLAAILAKKMPELNGKNVVCVLCGGNIDTTVLGRVLERGLATDGRICRFVVNVSDRPGGIAELTRLIASIGVSLKDIFHERAWLKSDVYSVQVRCIVETRNKEHYLELKELLRQNYTVVHFGDEGRQDLM